MQLIISYLNIVTKIIVMYEQPLQLRIFHAARCLKKGENLKEIKGVVVRKQGGLLNKIIRVVEG